jgi:hypothetical protein
VLAQLQFAGPQRLSMRAKMPGDQLSAVSTLHQLIPARRPPQLFCYLPYCDNQFFLAHVFAPEIKKATARGGFDLIFLAILNLGWKKKPPGWVALILLIANC